MKPYGAAELPVIKEPRVLENPTSGDWTLRQAMRTYQLWLLVISIFFYWGIGNNLVLAHQVKFAEDVGYSNIFATSTLAIFGVGAILGQLSSFISDLISREKAATLSVTLAIIALIALISVRDTSQSWLWYVYAILFGYATGIFSPTVLAATADIFYGRHFAAISSLLYTGMGIGGAIGPWLGGYIFDISGSYTIAFVVCIVSFVLAGVTFWLASPTKAARLQSRT